MTDKQAIYYELLVLRCNRGHKDAIEELVGNWERRLFYYIHRLIEDEQEAWAILQDVWIKVIQNINKIREPGKLPVWLYSVARKTVVSHLRKKYSRKILYHEKENSFNIKDCNSQYTFDNA